MQERVLLDAGPVGGTGTYAEAFATSDGLYDSASYANAAARASFFDGPGPHSTHDAHYEYASVADLVEAFESPDNDRKRFFVCTFGGGG